jgi:hypothetical protein
LQNQPLRSRTGLQPRKRGAATVRTRSPGWTSLAAAVLAAVVLTLLLSSNHGQASERDQALMTVQVSSADHEALEGYFTLGDSATVMVKPGSDLYNFLSRQRGRKVKITLEEASGPELSRLERLQR